ncbi:hypothetical protein [Methanoregula sp. PtaU1.Bin006]|nr:hypothetical protein [Methanoregula sp. PtaU1.Bin006]
MESTAYYPGTYLASILAIAALAFLLIVAGCTTTQPAPTPVPTAPPTTVQTPVATPTPLPSPTEDPDARADRVFAAAADACFEKTPVITNTTTHLEFATCMKNTPLPPGNCARNYRYYVLKATNEDMNTAGFARETNTARLAREAYRRGEGYDGVRQEYVPCGEATLIRSSIYQ